MATTAKILVWLILQMSDPPVPVPEGCSGTTEVSSPESRDEIISPGSSAGTNPPVLVGTALGTSCVLLNGQACLSELIINQG